jgi:hypothetical protein
MKFAKAFIPVAALGLLTACGDMSQNATGKYTLEDQVGELHGQRQAEQAPTAVAPIEISLKNAEFTVGQESKHEVSVTAPKGLAYSLRLEQAPQGMKLSNKAEGLFELSWKPTEKAVPLYHGTGNMEVKIVVDYNERASTNKEAVRALQSGQSTEQAVKVLVNRRAGQPQIKIVGGDIPASIEEGKSVSFVVEVTDPGTESQPDVSFSEVGVGSVNGERLIAIDLKKGLKRTENGTFQTRGILNANIKQLPKEVLESLEQSNGEIKIQFGFEVTAASSGAKLKTEMKTIALKLDKEASAPDLKIDQKGSSRGKKITITIMAVAKNERANTNINLNSLKAALEAEATKLPGKAELVNCKEGNNTPVHTCRIAWTVPCDAADLKAEYSLSVEAASKLFGDTKVATDTKQLRVGGACPTKKSTSKSSKKPVTTSKAPTAGGKK